MGIGAEHNNVMTGDEDTQARAEVESNVRGVESKSFSTRLLRSTLVHNIFSLYWIQIAGYVFPLITIPYLT